MVPITKLCGACAGLDPTSPMAITACKRMSEPAEEPEAALSSSRAMPKISPRSSLVGTKAGCFLRMLVSILIKASASVIAFLDSVGVDDFLAGTVGGVCGRGRAAEGGEGRDGKA